MRPVLLLCLMLLLAGCVDDYAHPVAESSPPAASPSGSASESPVAAVAGGPPYRSQLMQQYWAFEPGRTLYAHHGELVALRDDPGKVQVISIPTWPSVRPKGIGTSSSIRIVRLQEAPPASDSAWAMLSVIIEPTAKLKNGEVLRYDIAWEQARVPYLHDEGGGLNRLLSYSTRAFPDNPRAEFVFGVPDNAQQVSTADLQPFRTVPASGWKLYEYDVTGRALATIHLGFVFAGAPSVKPPSPAEVFSALPKQ